MNVQRRGRRRSDAAQFTDTKQLQWSQPQLTLDPTRVCPMTRSSRSITSLFVFLRRSEWMSSIPRRGDLSSRWRQR